MGEWISVEDRLPEGNCLVYLEKKESFHRIHTACYGGSVTIIAGRFDFDMPKVTHWMPLPEPPCNE